jgi:CO/xanthine dehydrogenase Mo-binding subunit
VQMDRIARTLGIDPWEIRLRNAYRNGEMRPVRKVVEDATLIETLKAAAGLVGHELSSELAAMHSDDAGLGHDRAASEQRVIR